MPPGVSSSNFLPPFQSTAGRWQERPFSGFLLIHFQKEVDPKRKHCKALVTFCQIPPQSFRTHSLHKSVIYSMRGKYIDLNDVLRYHLYLLSFVGFPLVFPLPSFTNVSGFCRLVFTYSLCIKRCGHVLPRPAVSHLICWTRHSLGLSPRHLPARQSPPNARQLGNVSPRPGRHRPGARASSCIPPRAQQTFPDHEPGSSPCFAGPSLGASAKEGDESPRRQGTWRLNQGSLPSSPPCSCAPAPASDPSPYFLCPASSMPLCLVSQPSPLQTSTT